MERRIELLSKALLDTPAADPGLLMRARELGLGLKDLQEQLSGDEVVSKHQEPVAPSIVGRVQRVVESQWSSTSAPTGTQRRAYEIASQGFVTVLEKLRTLVETDLKGLEAKAEAAGAPWTPGRVPEWKPEDEGSMK